MTRACLVPQPYLCSWCVIWREFSWALGNCIAVGQRAQKLGPDLLPPASLRGRDAQLEGSAVLGAVDDPRAAKKPVAQRPDAHALQPAQVPAKERGQVIC